MKYSDDMTEALRQLDKERKLFIEIIEGAPLAQLLTYLDDIGEELSEWAEHPDYTYQEIIEYAVEAVTLGIGWDDNETD